MLKCHFLGSQKHCTALKETNCGCCKFYKTTNQFFSDLKKSEEINKIKGVKYTVEEKKKEERRERYKLQKNKEQKK